MGNEKLFLNKNTLSLPLSHIQKKKYMHFFLVYLHKNKIWYA